MSIKYTYYKCDKCGAIYHLDVFNCRNKECNGKTYPITNIAETKGPTELYVMIKVKGLWKVKIGLFFVKIAVYFLNSVTFEVK